MKLKLALFVLLSCFFASKIYSFDIFSLFMYSEIAGRNSIFVDVGIELDIEKFEAKIIPLDICVDYVLPWPLPVSVGVYMNTPYPNLKHFGARAAYHLDLDDCFTDIYFLYNYDFGYIRNDLLLEYNDTPVEKRLYDFRVGIRRFFGYNRNIGMRVESGYHFQSIIVSITIKLN